MMSRFLIWENSYVEGFCVLTGLKGFNQPWLLAKGVALANNWPSDATFSMSPDYPTDMKLSDQVFGGSYRVVSIRLKEALSSIDESSNIEFLPVSILNHKGRLASKDYFIMNPLDSIDCINQDESFDPSCGEDLDVVSGRNWAVAVMKGHVTITPLCQTITQAIHDGSIKAIGQFRENYTNTARSASS